MKSTLLVVAVMSCGTFLLGRATLAGDERPTTIPARKYRVLVAESVLDWAHGGAVPVHGLFLPDAKVAAHLEYRSDLAADGRYRERPVLHAWNSDEAGTAVPEREGEPPRIDDIRIPYDLARQIEAHAELTRRYRDEGLRLGAEVRRRLGLEPLPNRRQ